MFLFKWTEVLSQWKSKAVTFCFYRSVFSMPTYLPKPSFSWTLIAQFHSIWALLPALLPWCWLLTLEGTFRMLAYKITEPGDYQTLLFPSLLELALELESLLQLSAPLHNSYGLITLFFGICSWLGGFWIIHSLPGPIPTQVLQLSLFCLIHTYSETNENTLNPSFIANIVCGFLC